MRGPAPQPWPLTGRGLVVVGVLMLALLLLNPWGA